ncbi:ribosome small subunit-dependent GTPase A [uncultured Kocuria sp.]|uniref:ribosome small subunit-dependent GTPase A n=1 Tax=uncultured Kocuria sp. TaxID=259305 RepID=UPI00259AE12F|nr:ribosome small subunit-dependent GTPase A [uncultured Kocuria sp.]MCT1367559.1 ribosome small subunit-dependent GTPase A [Rothia sp. p3-SID1597]
MARQPSRSWDESDVRVRANKRGSRPRTKERPAHRDAVIGRIVTVDRGRYTVDLGEDGPGRLITAVRAKDLRRTPVVVGDLVGLVGDVSGAEGSLARLVKVLERSTVLRRSADDTDPVERVVVANADQLIIVVAAANPTPRTGFIDRSIVAATNAGIQPVLCITKTDLGDATDLREYYSHTSLKILTSSPMGSAEEFTRVGTHETLRLDPSLLATLKSELNGHVSVFLGHSGVGKSTLVNALSGASRSTGGVNLVTGRGRHTSSSALAISPEWGLSGTWVVDTPGIRSFGLAHVEKDDIVAAFDDLAPGSAQCPKGCTHATDASDCGIAALVRSGAPGPRGEERLESLRRLLGVAEETGLAETKELGGA